MIMTIHAQWTNGEITPSTDEDRRKLNEVFPDGNIVLNSDNCPEIAAEIEKLSNEILAERKDLYRRLAEFD